jgi:GT2 family glycosyltransferase
MSRAAQAVDISVIIVNWNTKGFLEECLQSLATATHSLEVVVVDNHSSDGSPEMVRRQFPQVNLLCNESNVGFARGNNQGIRASTGRFVCLINSDARMLPGCLDALAAYLDANPEMGMAGPRVRNRDMTLQSTCRRFPHLWNNFCEAFALPRLFPHSSFFAGEHMFYFKHDRIIFPDVLVGCFIMARREAVDEFGMLDEAFFMYGEDIDWSMRCWKAGWKVAFFPGAEAVHHLGGSSKKDPVKYAVALQRARLQFWAKHYSRAANLGLAALLALENGIRWLANALSAALKTSRRADATGKMQRHAACLKALFVRSPA